MCRMGYFAITSNFVVILNLLVLTKKILRKIKTILVKNKTKEEPDLLSVCQQEVYLLY